MKFSGLGLFCSLGAAVGYTIANGFLKSVSDCDPAWVSMIKALWTLLIFGPVFAFDFAKGKKILGTKKTFWWLVFGSILGQFAGNLAFQWSLQYIGVSLSVPLMFGTMVISAAILGRVFLKEDVSKQVAVAIVVLLGSIVVLNWGAGQLPDIESDWTDQEKVANHTMVTLAALSASVCGFSYAVLGVTIRFFMRTVPHVSTPLVLVGFSGVICLGSFSLVLNGPSIFWEHSGAQLMMMSLAGIFNAVAFLSLTKALELLPLAYVNSINVSQVAMCALVGVFFFTEPVTIWLVTGCMMTIGGFFLLNFKLSTLRKKMGVTPKDDNHVESA